MLPSERWRQLLGVCLLLAGGQQLAAAGVIKAKAWLAPVLIERAWEESLARKGSVPPWPWADTWPIARLRVPAAGVNLLVLAGDSGNALAFGPGHARASAQPGHSGTVVIGGHRDTHFAFLGELKPTMMLYLEAADGVTRSYRVEASTIVDASTHRLAVHDPQDRLLLVTCYPFDALRAGGPLRYVVTARPTAQTITRFPLIGNQHRDYTL